tara:strand:+ start:840 stop:1199 length:360 start_codon:yes stop_codon:yes gene_type:complete
MKMQDKFKDALKKASSKDDESLVPDLPNVDFATANKVEAGPVFGINVGQPTRPESLKVLDDVQANVKKDENGNVTGAVCIVYESDTGVEVANNNVNPVVQSYLLGIGWTNTNNTILQGK